ncbi:MAG: DUF4215 domain-containing protein [Polyangiaceae bacterium]|nr:DUF4215 domain-containing protein [Polyangiaceae bacterium]
MVVATMALAGTWGCSHGSTGEGGATPEVDGDWCGVVQFEYTTLNPEITVRAPLRFSVEGSEIVSLDHSRVVYYLHMGDNGLDAIPCAVEFAANVPARVSGGAFEVPLTGTESDSVVRGTFLSSTEAEGTVDATELPSEGCYGLSVDVHPEPRGTFEAGREPCDDLPEVPTDLEPDDPAVTPAESCAGYEGLDACTPEVIASSPVDEPTRKVFVVLDKSGSMADTLADSVESKWSVVEATIGNVVTHSRVEAGLLLYPYPVAGLGDCGDQCCAIPSGASAVNVPVGGGAAAIADILASTSPGGSSPTADALAAAVEYFSTGEGFNLTGEKHVLLVTDGAATCGDVAECAADSCSLNIEGLCDADPASCCTASGEACIDDAAVMDQIERLSAWGVTTSVIGLPGAEPYLGAVELSAAVGGGVPYDATSGSSDDVRSAIEQAVSDIAGPCAFELAQSVGDSGEANVAIDCTILDASSAGGSAWTVVANRLEVLGAACASLTADRTVEVLTGCSTDATPSAVCGNGQIEAEERCDDGTNSGEYGGCNPDCTLASHCGDGILDEGEECDTGVNDGSYGGCEPDCTLAPHCGDGIVQSESGELCDDGEGNVSTGYGEGVCITDCLPAPRCGDGVIDAGETCDDGNADSLDGCSADCAWEDGWTCPIAGQSCVLDEQCGNGILNSEEECDDGNTLPGDCCDEFCFLEPSCS